MTRRIITVNAEEQAAGGWQVTLAAADEGSGVRVLYYSLDGTNFQLYTAPFAVALQTSALHLFADDNMGNRATQVIPLEASPIELHRLCLSVLVR
jgi:hypothetical protein